MHVEYGDRCVVRFVRLIYKKLEFLPSNQLNNVRLLMATGESWSLSEIVWNASHGVGASSTWSHHRTRFFLRAKGSSGLVFSLLFNTRCSAMMLLIVDDYWFRVQMFLMVNDWWFSIQLYPWDLDSSWSSTNFVGVYSCRPWCCWVMIPHDGKWFKLCINYAI